MNSIRAQIHRNAVALISLFIALGSLGYNTWRNETTEAHRNIRHASFRVLESLGELQEVVDYRYYYLPFEASNENEGLLRLRGFGSVLMIRDLMNLMPAPGPEAGKDLHGLWNSHVNFLDEISTGGQHSKRATTAEQELGNAINASRKAIIKVLKSPE